MSDSVADAVDIDAPECATCGCPDASLKCSRCGEAWSVKCSHLVVTIMMMRKTCLTRSYTRGYRFTIFLARFNGVYIELARHSRSANTGPSTFLTPFAPPPTMRFVHSRYCDRPCKKQHWIKGGHKASCMRRGSADGTPFLSESEGGGEREKKKKRKGKGKAKAETLIRDSNSSVRCISSTNSTSTYCPAR